MQAQSAATQKNGPVAALLMGNGRSHLRNEKMPQMGSVQTLKRRRCRGKMGVVAMCKTSLRRSIPGSAGDLLR